MALIPKIKQQKHTENIISNAIFDHLPGYVYWKNKKGVYLGYNAKHIQNLGLSKISDIIGKTDFEIWDKKTAEELRRNDLFVMKTGRSIIVEETVSIKGTPFVVITNKSPLKDVKGKTIGITGISIDIGKQKTKEKEITKQLSHDLSQHKQDLKKIKQEYDQNKLTLDNIIANLPGYVYWKNKEGLCLGCNQKQANAFGFKSVHDVINKTNSELLGKKISKNDLVVMNTGKSHILEEITIINGEKIVGISHKAPLKDEKGKVVGIMSVTVDITKQKEKEKKISAKAKQLTQALEKRRKFLGNVSHEIRTPLQGIHGLLQEIKGQWKTLDDKKRFSLVNKVANNSDRLMKLVSNLLDLSRIDFETLALNKQYYDLKTLVTHTIKEFNNYDNVPKISLHVSEDCNTQTNLDTIRITQVIRNLISNAIRYGKEKNIDIKIENCFIKQLLLHDDWISAIKLSIIDRGIGIPEEEMDRIFEPFKESSKSKIQDKNGVGLGLSICKEIVEVHGGEIWAKNNKTGGASFSFVIPCYKNENEITDQLSDTKIDDLLIEQNHIKNLTILFVDDEDVCTSYAQLLFPNLGHNVIIASNGFEALKVLEKNWGKIDIIFLDLMMPGTSGIETLKQIKTNKNYQNIPVIIQSGISDGLEISKAIKLGARKECLQKPFSRDDIIQMLNKIFVSQI